MARAEMILCEDQWDSKKSHCHMSVLVPFGFAVFLFPSNNLLQRKSKSGSDFANRKSWYVAGGGDSRTPQNSVASLFCLFLLTRSLSR